MRVDNRQRISYFSCISKRFHIKQAGVLRVVTSSSINCSVLEIRSVQSQHRSFKFLLTHREISQSSARQDPAGCSPTTAPYGDGHREAKGTGSFKTTAAATERSSACSCTPTAWKNKPKIPTQTTSPGQAGVLRQLSVT